MRQAYISYFLLCCSLNYADLRSESSRVLPTEAAIIMSANAMKKKIAERTLQLKDKSSDVQVCEYFYVP